MRAAPLFIRRDSKVFDVTGPFPARPRPDVGILYNCPIAPRRRIKTGNRKYLI
jgi:hypothetical protein